MSDGKWKKLYKAARAAIQGQNDDGEKLLELLGMGDGVRGGERGEGDN